MPLRLFSFIAFRLGLFVGCECLLGLACPPDEFVLVVEVFLHILQRREHKVPGGVVEPVADLARHVRAIVPEPHQGQHRVPNVFAGDFARKPVIGTEAQPLDVEEYGASELLTCLIEVEDQGILLGQGGGSGEGGGGDEKSGAQVHVIPPVALERRLLHVKVSLHLFKIIA